MFRNIPKQIIIALLVAALAVPAFAQRGSANFTRYVAVGDSLTAGFQSGGLVMTHQRRGFPAIIAQQAGVTDFQQPLISEPGIPGLLQLQSLSPLVIAPKQGLGQPVNLLLQRPYNNLGIPGADVGELLTITGADPTLANPYYQIILRGLGPAVGQAAALQPTFVTIWAGNNDVLSAVTSGIANEITLTPLNVFAGNYLTMLEALTTAAPNAGMVAATVPPVTEITFANVLPPVVIDATRTPIPGPDGNPIFLVAEFGDGSIGQLTPGSKVLLSAQALLSTGYGIPAALAPVIPLPNVGRPLPNTVVLDPAEIARIEEHRVEVNSLITTAAANYNIPVLNVDPIFGEFAEGVEVAGIEFSFDFLTGGIMSYDGVHPSDIGHLFVANAFIERINEAYDANIPYASLLTLFANNAPVEASMLPPWVELNLLEAPWSEFRAPFAEVDLSEPDEPAEDAGSSRGRTIRRGPRG